MSLTLLKELFNITSTSQELTKWVMDFQRIERLGEVIHDGTIEAKDYSPDLWEDQALAIERILRYGSLGLFDDRGKGKTRVVLEAIRRSQADGARKAIVVTSRRLRSVWRRDCERWWAADQIVLPEGRIWSEAADQIGDATITVVTYQALLNADVVKAIKELDPYFAIVEEAHNVKKRARTNKKVDARGRVTRTPTLSGAVRKLPGTVRIAVTGTPMPNYWWEVWPLLNFVAPHEFSSFWQMIEVVGKVTENYWGGKDIDSRVLRPELWYRMMNRWTVRRERTGRNTIWDFVPVELSSKERVAYRSMQKDMIVEQDGMVLDAKNVLDQATKLQQLAGGLGTWKTWVDGDGIMRSRYSISAPSSKTEVLLDMLRGLHRAVVFTRFRNRAEFVASEIEKELEVEAIVISGGQTENMTDQLLDRFMHDEVPLVAVCVFGTISEGVNELVAAQDVFFLDWITVSQVEQAVDRLDRPGQKGQVRAVTLYSTGTVDELAIDRERNKVIPLRIAIRSKDGWRYLVDFNSRE